MWIRSMCNKNFPAEISFSYFILVCVCVCVCWWHVMCITTSCSYSAYKWGVFSTVHYIQEVNTTCRQVMWYQLHANAAGLCKPDPVHGKGETCHKCNHIYTEWTEHVCESMMHWHELDFYNRMMSVFFWTHSNQIKTCMRLTAAVLYSIMTCVMIMR